MLVLSFCMIAVANDMHNMHYTIIIIGDYTVFIKLLCTAVKFLFLYSHSLNAYCVVYYVVCICDYCVHN